MVTEQSAWVEIAGNAFLGSVQDSITNDLSIGRRSLPEAAIAESRLLLSVPGAQDETRPSSRSFMDEGAMGLIPLLDTLISRTDSVGHILGVQGARLSRGITRFPGDRLYELLIAAPPPWRCAVVSQDSGTARTVGCYAVDPTGNRRSLSIFLADGIERRAKQNGLRQRFLSSPTAAGAVLRIAQWLLEDGRRRILVSYYDEPLDAVGQLNPYLGRRLLWFSFEALPIN
jgi:hypothetical protein